MDLAKEILRMFEGFIKRSLMPSAVFFVIFMGIGFAIGEAQKSGFYSFMIELLSKKENSVVDLLAVVILFVGVSYILSIIMQMVYDNNIKKNYNTFLFWTYENKELDRLRRRVFKKTLLNNKYKKVKARSDYMFYQLLGNEYGGNLNRYVDETKSVGIFFLSLIISSFYWLYLFTSCELCLLLGIVLGVFLYFVGCDTIKTRYRSRAIRLYVNYLIEDQKED